MSKACKTRFDCRARFWACALLTALHVPVWAQFADGRGREWRQVVDTAGLAWSDLARACPGRPDGACVGVLGGITVDGWRWASEEEVMGLFNTLLVATPHAQAVPSLSLAKRSVAGVEAFTAARAALSGPFRPAFSAGTHYLMITGLHGMTSTLGPDGRVILGTIDLAHGLTQPGGVEGRFTVEPQAPPEAVAATVGAWMWRPADFVGTVVLSAVPEAGTTPLWAAGLCVLGLAARRTYRRVPGHR